jgi:hypothetical protein
VNNYLPIFFCFPWFCSADGPCCGGNDSSNNNINNKKKESTEAKFYFKTKLPKSCCLSCIHTHTHSLLVCVCVCVFLVPKRATFGSAAKTMDQTTTSLFNQFRLLLTGPVCCNDHAHPIGRVRIIRFRAGFRNGFGKFLCVGAAADSSNDKQRTRPQQLHSSSRFPRFKISRQCLWRTQRLNLKKIKEEKKFLRLRPAFPSVAGHSLPHVYGRRQFRPKKGKKMFGSYFQNASFLRVLFVASRQPHSSVRIPRYRTHHPPQ